MPDTQLVTLSTYPDEGSAAIARSVLAAAGIDAHTTDGATTTTLWHVGTALGGVRLQVPASEVDVARRVLEKSQQTDDTALPQQPWTCPRCDAQVDAGYAVCWSCMAPAPESAFTPASDLSTEPSAEVADEESSLDLTEAEQVALKRDQNAAETGDALADRALRAALIGVVVPFVLPYAALLVLRLVGHHDRSSSASRKFYAALAVVFLMCCAWWALLSPL
jgi:thiol:disulfide interchange protein